MFARVGGLARTIGSRGSKAKPEEAIWDPYSRPRWQVITPEHPRACSGTKMGSAALPLFKHSKVGVGTPDMDRLQAFSLISHKYPTIHLDLSQCTTASWWAFQVWMGSTITALSCQKAHHSIPSTRWRASVDVRPRPSRVRDLSAVPTGRSSLHPRRL
jgi:hypothetical protein